MGLGENIKILAAKKNMSIRELSRESKVPHDTLYSAIRRDSNNMDYKYVRSLATVLEVAISVLVGMENMENYIDDIKKELGNYDWSDEMEDELYKLNSEGRKKAVELVELLTKIPEYSRQDVYDDIYESERED